MIKPRSDQKPDGLVPADDTSTSINSENVAIDRTIVDGSAPVAVTAHWPGVGSNLGKYEIRQELGRGGMGAVYLGFDTVLEREVAIKVLPPEVEARPNTLNRFLAEAKATGKLNHPHVVAIYDLGEANGLHYFVMEVLRGGSVADLIEQRGGLPWKEACELIAQAADGLSAAHMAGLVHRDIKPENLMFTADGVVKVVDFGVSKLIDEEATLHMTAAGQLLGTPHYMSPEQVRATEIDARSDVYNLGATFYRLLTGHYPFEDCKAVTQVLFAHLERPVPSALTHVSEIPPECDLVVNRAMAKTPEARYQTAGEFAKALRALVAMGNAGVASPRGNAPAGTYRALQDVAIIEPSKMQAMLLERACKRAGATIVRLYTGMEGALQALETNPPDLLITAQQLSDGLGLSLIERTRKVPSLKGLPILLSSTDLQFDDVVRSSAQGWIGLASKKTRPEEILQGVEAGTFLTMPAEQRISGKDLSSRSLLLLCDRGRVPLPIAELLRELGLLNVHVSDIPTVPEMTLQTRFDLALVVSGKPVTRSDAAQIAGNAWKNLNSSISVLAVAGVDESDHTFRLLAVNRSGFASVMDCPLDTERFMRLLGAGVS